ncbi:hypothetical protein HALLA_21180 (plasmid) [Halostagnicola larsenii XH-48]|uniref:Uncharacterized protein n=1 Tax=Halostagnicola larsenii XH-48 TaxID=797299 RepID=W0JV23_9EURY|nr:hypothetical protein HALLA_21180 [Halostagnicola larsenii XH-48]
MNELEGDPTISTTDSRIESGHVGAHDFFGHDREMEGGFAPRVE